MGMVDDRRDSSDGDSILPGQKRLDFRIIIESVRLVIQQLFLVRNQGWNPVWVALVVFPRESDKFLLKSFIGYWDDFDSQLGFPSSRGCDENKMGRTIVAMVDVLYKNVNLSSGNIRG